MKHFTPAALDVLRVLATGSMTHQCPRYDEFCASHPRAIYGMSAVQVSLATGYAVSTVHSAFRALRTAGYARLATTTAGLHGRLHRYALASRDSEASTAYTRQIQLQNAANDAAAAVVEIVETVTVAELEAGDVVRVKQVDGLYALAADTAVLAKMVRTSPTGIVVDVIETERYELVACSPSAAAVRERTLPGDAAELNDDVTEAEAAQLARELIEYARSGLADPAGRPHNLARFHARRRATAMYGPGSRWSQNRLAAVLAAIEDAELVDVLHSPLTVSADLATAARDVAALDR